MMKLSEAIRLGATIRPQTHGCFHTPGGRRSCALGAAKEAMGLVPHPLKTAKQCRQRDGSLVIYPIGSMVFDWPVEWRATFVTVAYCPVPGCTCLGTVKSIIAHLNDDHRWTRERIADVVASVEVSQAQPAVDAVHA